MTTADEEKDFEVLPVIGFKEELVRSIRQNKILICIGETGSGKTTQLPQFFLDCGLVPDEKMVAVTQPRRVAAVTVAQRVASERNCEVGEEVGYSIRFDDNCTGRTRLKFMTDGILVRECLRDPLLSQYSVVMLDEAHERSIHTDILFGLLKAAVHRRAHNRDERINTQRSVESYDIDKGESDEKQDDNDGALRLVVTSATLNADKFSSYFGHCPVIRVPGRVFPGKQ